MLMRAKTQSGVTLIELMIGLVVVGLLLSLGLPSFGAWLQNIAIRDGADAIQNGLQVARAEAVRQNTLVSFTLPGPGPAYSVTVDDPPSTVQVRDASEGSPNVVVDMAAPHALPFVVTFDGLGKSNLAQQAMIQVTNPNGGTCRSVAGPMTCLNISIAVGGQVKMCDPFVTTAGDTRAC